MIVNNIASFTQYQIYKRLRTSLIALEFLNGLLASHHLCFYFLYTQKYNVSLLTYSIFEIIVCCLFCLNPFMGYLADTYPFFGYRRKSYLILVGCIGTIGYLLAAMIHYFNISIFMAFLFHFFIDSSNAFRGVIMDSLCVTMNNCKKKVFINTRANESTKSVAMIFASKLLGKIISNAIFGLFYQFVQEKCKFKRLFLFSMYCFCNDNSKF